MTRSSDYTGVIAVPGLPLSFRVAPIRGFLEVGLADGQPMIAVEVQIVDADSYSRSDSDADSQPAIIVLMHRADRSIDLAVSDPRLDEDWFRQDPCMCHMPLGRITTATFQRNHCRIDERSVEIDLSLEAEHLPGRLEIAAKHKFDRPGRPSFVPAVPGVGGRPTLRLILVGSVRGLPRSADPVIKLGGDQLELAPLMRAGPIVLARPARLGSDVFGVGLNLSGTVDVPTVLDPVGANGGEPVELIAERGQHRLGLRLLTSSGAPITTMDLSDSGSIDGQADGQFVIDGSLGPLVTGDWQLEADRSAVTLTLDQVTQQWSPGWTNPVGVARDMARRRRRTGERWRWAGQWQQDEDNTDRHIGQWTVQGKA